MKTILIIDDDEGVRTLLARILEIGSHSVLEADNGRKALGLLATHAVDMVITDIIMPDMEGIEIIMRLRRTHPHLPIIAISGGARISANDHLTMARKLGADLTLCKPVSPAELLEAVHHVFTSHAESGQADCAQLAG